MEQINVERKNRLFTDEKELVNVMKIVVTVMKIVFVNITEGLDIKKDNDSFSSVNYQNINDVLEKFENHRSVDKISQTFMTNEKFSFKTVTEDVVGKEIMNLHGSKVTLNGDTSVNILKSTVDIHLR